jgi:hypothetical protein
MSAEDSPGNESGFLQRWSRRKQAVREGVVPADVAAEGTARPAAIVPQPVAQTSPGSNPSPDADPGADLIADTKQTELPSLDSLHGLQSDYLDFMQPKVAQHLKRAALKKLFADPHFNVMDGLDVYIDDYSQPDPLAPALLRQMASAQFLNLTDEPQELPPGEPTGGNSLSTGLESVKQGAHRPSSETLDHDHTDLRLQPDSSTRRPDTGPASV